MIITVSIAFSANRVIALWATPLARYVVSLIRTFTYGTEEVVRRETNVCSQYVAVAAATRGVINMFWTTRCALICPESELALAMEKNAGDAVTLHTVNAAVKLVKIVPGTWYDVGILVYSILPLAPKKFDGAHVG